MQTDRSLCSVCKKSAAEKFCPCASPETFLCAKCVGAHMSDVRVHSAWPISQLLYYKIPGYAERIQTRLDHFPQVRIQALQQATLIDKAFEEFTYAVEATIWDILQYAERTKEELQALKSEMCQEIEKALEEVERTLVEDQPLLLSRLGSVFRGLTEHLQPFQLFSYNLNTSPTLAVTLTSQLQLSQAAVQNQLVHVTESYYRFFNFQTGTWKQQLPLNPHIHADLYSRWAVLEEGSVFICGGMDLNTAYIVGVGCEQQGKMHEARSSHGVLAYRNHAVYAFGGLGFNSCEKYHLQNHTWTVLQPMKQARSDFNPCLFNGSIYLCGWGLLEAFSPQNDQMLPPARHACIQYLLCGGQPTGSAFRQEHSQL